MIGWLRRRQPDRPVLAVLYWVLLAAVLVAVLAVLFFQLDRLLPASY